MGGAPLNFAAHCVLRGANSGLISMVGKDELGESALRAISEYNIYPYIATTDKPTGRCMVVLDKNKVPHYNIEKDVAYDQLQTRQYVDEIRDHKYDVCCFGTLIQRNPRVREQINYLIKEISFKDIFCDINLRKENYDNVYNFSNRISG